MNAIVFLIIIAALTYAGIVVAVIVGVLRIIRNDQGKREPAPDAMEDLFLELSKSEGWAQDKKPREHRRAGDLQNV